MAPHVKKAWSLLLAILPALSHALPMLHSGSSSQYIHSNDTYSLTLSAQQLNKLHGPVGSVHTLEFLLVNHYTGSYFSFEQDSEDNFGGVLPMTGMRLEQGQQQTIPITNLVVPPRPIGSKVKLTLTVRRDSEYGRNKREAPPNQNNNNNGNYGGSGNVGGSGGGGYYPGGNNNNNNNNGGYYPGGNNNNNNNGGNYWNNDFSDPSYRRELSLTVEFTVTEDLKDSKKPWTQLSYFADSQSDTCSYEPGDANCDMDVWWTKYRIQDEKSGLHLVQFTPTDSYGPQDLDRLYYRYENFAVGTDKEFEVVAAASCCLKGITLRVTDVAGNVAEVEAWNGKTGTPMSSSLFYGLIGGGVALVVIIIVVLVACCCKKRYTAVSTD